MQQNNNIIYVSGNTYEHRKELDRVGHYNGIAGGYIVPISRGEEVNELAGKYQLTATPTHDPDYIEPKNEKEWELLRTKGRLDQAKVRLQELRRKRDEISSKTDVGDSEIQGIEISITEMEERIATLKEGVQRLQEELKRNETQTLVFKSLAELDEDWFSSVPPQHPMLLKDSKGRGFLPKGIVALMAAAGGTGKTRIASQLAFCIAAGLPFVEEFENVSKRGARVFLGLGEEPEDGIRRRLYSVAQYYLANPLQPNFDINEVKRNLVTHSLRGQNMSLVDENGLATPQYTNLLNALKQSQGEGYSLIILDPLSRFLGANSEVDNGNGTQFISLMERMTIELKGNPTILLVHHTNKGGDWRSQNASRGSSSIPAGARWQINFVNEFTRVTTGQKDSAQNDVGNKKHLKVFVRGDLVKNNDVPPLESDIILKFDKEGVLVPTTEEEIKPEGGAKNTPSQSSENEFADYM